MQPLGRLTAALADRYRLERELGAGGMATVYLAEDPKHHRRVAIKVLHPELSAIIGSERFLKEIELTASLQHPNILPLFDSGTADGLLYYVMPYVEGETLRTRLERETQLPIPDAVRIAGEVAGALDYAHRRGIIHRDIKPENILLHDGRALVADFGIARAASTAGGSRLTETGMSLGTPAYMSPEQAMGERDVGPRSDVYALGAMTYEMLAGTPPFTGPTAQAIVAKVIASTPPPLTESRAKVPAAVEAAVLTALEKLPADRFASAAEFAAALTDERMAERPRSLAAGSRTKAPALARLALILGGAAALIAAAFAAGRRTARPVVSEQPPSWLELSAPRLGGPSTSTTARDLDISPSGDAIVYVARRDSGGTALYLRRLDSEDPVVIPGSAGLLNPRFTPRGDAIIATSPTGGVRLPLSGGSATSIPLASTRLNGAWAPDGSYWWNPVGINGIQRLTPSDSLVSRPFGANRLNGLRVQQVLADGRHALAIQGPASTLAGPVVSVDLQTGAIAEVSAGLAVVVRSMQGELVSVQADGSIVSAPFDEPGRRVLGPAVQVAQRAVSFPGVADAEFVAAANGTVAFIRSAAPSLVLVDREGHEQTLLAEVQTLHAPSFSPDGRRLAFDMVTPEGRDVWLLPLGQGFPVRVTHEKDGHDATWSTDGRSIFFTSYRSGVHGIYRLRPGSTAPAESLLASAKLQYTGRMLRSGAGIITLAVDMHEGSGMDVVRIANGGHGPIESLVASEWLERYSMPSPDGSLVAFTSDQSGREEVYIQPLSPDGVPVQVSQAGGTEPVWAPDGQRLYYRGFTSSDFMLFEATVRSAPELEVASQRVLFSVLEMAGTGPHANYDVSPDDRHFAMIRQSASKQIIVIQNLPALARRLRAVRASAP